MFLKTPSLFYRHWRHLDLTFWGMKKDGFLLLMFCDEKLLFLFLFFFSCPAYSFFNEYLVYCLMMYREWREPTKVIWNIAVWDRYLDFVIIGLPGFWRGDMKGSMQFFITHLVTASERLPHFASFIVLHQIWHRSRSYFHQSTTYTVFLI